MTREESQASAAWRPGIGGYSVDILPWIDAIAPTRPKPLALVEIGVLYGRSILYWAERLRQLGHGADTRLVLDQVECRFSILQGRSVFSSLRDLRLQRYGFCGPHMDQVLRACDDGQDRSLGCTRHHPVDLDGQV